MRLYLEVDGVINAVYGPRAWAGQVAEGRSNDVFDSVTFDGYTFVWSREVVSRLVEWAERDGNEIVWASIWDPQIDILSRVLGFGRTGADARSLQVRSAKDSPGKGYVTPFSKLQAILEDVKENPVPDSDWVALDPEIAVMLDAEGDSLEWLKQLAIVGGDVPPIDANVGITPGMMMYLDKYADIENWAEQMAFDLFGDEDGEV